jgi:hypothetical protein
MVGPTHIEHIVKQRLQRIDKLVPGSAMRTSPAASLTYRGRLLDGDYLGLDVYFCLYVAGRHSLVDFEWRVGLRRTWGRPCIVGSRAGLDPRRSAKKAQTLVAEEDVSPGQRVGGAVYADERA